MVMFPTYPDCQKCTLSAIACNRGISTRSLKLEYPVHKKAVLVVGSAPNLTEDEIISAWTGDAANLMLHSLSKAGVAEHSDVYLTHACRCRAPQNSHPSISNLNVCRPYLQADLDTLRKQYDEVVILCTGKWGAIAVTKQNGLGVCFSFQGQKLSFFNKKRKGGLTGDSPVFFTFHPGMLLPHNNPGKIPALADHLILLTRYLVGNFEPNALKVVPEFNAPVPFDVIPTVKRVAVDIETYGILKGQHQSVFHPMKSQYIDGVTLGKQIVTCAFGYYDAHLKRYRTMVYDWAKHKRQIYRWFQLIIKHHILLIGQNIKFDILYLQMNDPVLRTYLTPKYVTLDDTMLVSFLLNEQRPELGLKELSKLFGLKDYTQLAVTAKSGRAKTANDPALLMYNCVDIAVTLALYDYSWSQIGKVYSVHTNKVGHACDYMRNAILWDCIALERAGVAMWVAKLKELDRQYRHLCECAEIRAGIAGVKIKGTGSKKSTLEYMEQALDEAGIINDERVMLTEKRREISVGKDNFNLLAEYSDQLSGRNQIVLADLQSHHKYGKLVSSYTNKLLNQPKQGIVHDNLTYPGWFPWPSRYAKSETAKGGTLQGRFACHRPAAQTFPPPIKKCITSRFKGGRIRCWDLSQIELRIAALLSGDPNMMQDYIDGVDRHTQTALFFFPDADITSDEFLRKPDGLRQCGKTTNFLVLYKGGANKLRETIMKDLGRDIPLHVCVNAIKAFDKHYPDFRRWQDWLIDTVARDGYLETVTGWTRRWGVGRKAAENNVNEIADFPIQTTAAQILQGAHYEMECSRESQKLRSLFILQQHDSLFVDEFPGEGDAVEAVVTEHLHNPCIYKMICQELGRAVPLEFEEE